MELLVLLLASLTLATVMVQPAAGAIEYQVINNATGTPGGARFDREIGADYNKQVMINASSFIWKILELPPNETKRVTRAALIVDPLNGVSYTTGSEIHLSADYVASYKGDVKAEVTGLLYHEMTHVWQPEEDGAVADFVRLTAGYPRDHETRNQLGQKDMNRRFIAYCRTQKTRVSFVTQVKNFMKDNYMPLAFVELSGRMIYELWVAYSAYYGLALL